MRCEARVRTLNSGLRERVQSVHGSSGRMNEYVYIYIYICVCVCVCVYAWAVVNDTYCCCLYGAGFFADWRDGAGSEFSTQRATEFGSCRWVQDLRSHPLGLSVGSCSCCCSFGVLRLLGV